MLVRGCGLLEGRGGRRLLRGLTRQIGDVHDALHRAHVLLRVALVDLGNPFVRANLVEVVQLQVRPRLALLDGRRRVAS